MAQAKQGDTVKVNYTGKLEDGTVFDSSVERDPLEFKIGEGHVIPGFETAVSGMSPGEEKTIDIAAEEAYGQRREDLVMEVERERFPEDVQPQAGDHLQLSNPDGSTFIVTVSGATDSTVTLDANHPLAGKDLSFDIKLEDIHESG